MANGYDFTQDDNEIGFDFTTDDTELIAQEEAREAELWENLDESAVKGEINGLNKRICIVVKELERIVSDNNYEETAERIKALLTRDLSAEGWIDKFCVTNREVFGKTTGADWMTWFNNLPSEKQKRFRDVQEYYRDACALLETGARVYELLRVLPLKEGFRIARIKSNFERSGLRKDAYDAIDDDARSFSVQLNQDWAAMERNAERSAMYYEANKSKLPPEKLAYGYYQERLKDYLDNLKKHVDMMNLVDRGNGQFGVNPVTYANTGGLDKYTFAISQLPDLRDLMGGVLERADKILSAEIPAAEKACRTQACQFLVGAFRTLVEAVAAFAGSAKEIYADFRGGSDDFPYCFMKRLSAFGSLQPRYSYNPDTSDPWENGTYFQEMYVKAAKAIGEHCKEFVYHHGVEF